MKKDTGGLVGSAETGPGARPLRCLPSSGRDDALADRRGPMDGVRVGIVGGDRVLGCPSRWRRRCPGNRGSRRRGGERRATDGPVA
ncbi:MAG: hypothetical protein AVDCRST_MAG49-1560 [uncultured Thermomicrobiales bacterium]|uniref:Uncharacterized protein n=1 Tax=uncultured Thermomicrobiales bacterium TaxID=1645740 RepID=A0A6J4UIS5_9BACT|nr:MAG: hypothetical protein AVDCRST_MAG49-1560 [uncultured Thermomicrobiales bacterium]